MRRGDCHLPQLHIGHWRLPWEFFKISSWVFAPTFIARLANVRFGSCSGVMCLNLNLNIRFGSGNSPNMNTNQMFRFMMFGSCSNTVRQLKIDLLLFFWQNFVGVGWTSPGFFDDVSHELALQHAISRYHTFVSPLICYILTILNYLYSVLDLMATSFFVLQLSSEFDITCRTWKPEVNKYLWLIFFLLITPTTDEWRHITNHSATTTAPTTNKWWYIRVGQTQWQKVEKGLGYVFYLCI